MMFLAWLQQGALGRAVKPAGLVQAEAFTIGARLVPSSLQLDSSPALYLLGRGKAWGLQTGQ